MSRQLSPQLLGTVSPPISAPPGFSRYRVLLDVSLPLCGASLRPRVGSSMTPSPGPKKTPKNRRLHDEPVLLDGDEEIDHSSVPPLATPSGPVPTSDKSDAGGPFGAVVGAARKPLTAPQGSAALSSTEKAWGPIVADGLQAVEAATQRSAARSPNLDHAGPQPVEPAGTIGSPEVRAVTLDAPMSSDWAIYPRSEGSFSFEELLSLGRGDAKRIDLCTQTDAAWALGVRARFLQNYWTCYQVPASLPCDRSMIQTSYDAGYLEGMVRFLTGKQHLPPSVEEQFWRFDLPPPSPSKERTSYDILRTQWTATYGFGRIISFADHDALRVNETAHARFDVVVAATERQTQYRGSLEKFVPLPSWIRDLKLPGGLCLRLPRVLLYMGSEVSQPTIYVAYHSRLTYAVRLEMARALASAVDCDYYHSQIVWVLSEAAVGLLQEFSSTPEVDAPDWLQAPRGPRGLSETAEASLAARGLGDEYLFERYHIATGEWVRWAFLTQDGFAIAQSFGGPRRGGRPVVGARRRPVDNHSRGDVPGGYQGGFRAARQAPTSPKVAPNRRATLSSIIDDRDVRRARGLGVLLEDHAVRDAGWSIKELLGLTIEKAAEWRRSADDAEHRCSDLEGRLKTANRQVDMWREHSERVVRPYAGASEPASYPRDHPSRSAVEERYMDPYSSVKRSRFAYDRRDTRAASPSQPTTIPRVPITRKGAGRDQPQDLYDEEPYAASDRHYR